MPQPPIALPPFPKTGIFSDFEDVYLDKATKAKAPISITSPLKHGGDSTGMSPNSSARSSASDDGSSSRSEGLGSRSEGTGIERRESAASSAALRRLDSIREAREGRRRALESIQPIVPECELEALPAAIRTLFAEQLDASAAPAHIYRVVTSTVTAYLKGRSSSKTLDGKVADFIHSILLRPARELGEDERTMRARREIEASVLMELHAAPHAEGGFERAQLRVGSLLRALYKQCDGDKTLVRDFLENDVVDLFGHTQPSLVIEIFEEIAIPLPVDLQESEGDDEDTPIDDLCPPTFSSPPREKRSNGHANASQSLESRLEAMLEENRDDEEEPTKAEASQSTIRRHHSLLSTGASQRTTQRSSQRTAASQASQEGALERREKRKAIPTTPTREHRRARPSSSRRIFVPETPDEKASPSKRRAFALATPSKTITSTPQKKAGVEDDIKAVVQQTPMEKVLRARKSGRGTKLAELVTQAVNTPSPASLAAASGESSAKAVIERRKALRSSMARPMERKTSREEFLSANRPRRGEEKERLRAKMNLASKFAASPSSAEKKKNGEIPGLSTPRKEEKKKTIQRIEDLALDSEATTKYRDRMKETNIEGRKGDHNEVFYGRMSNRVGLFDDREDEKEKHVMSFNRAGRMVYSPSCVFVAHTLLNTHNPSPLVPPQPSAAQPPQFKVHRLVRPASKGNQLKMKKFAARVLSQSPKKTPTECPSKTDLPPSPKKTAN